MTVKKITIHILASFSLLLAVSVVDQSHLTNGHAFSLTVQAEENEENMENEQLEEETENDNQAQTEEEKALETVDETNESPTLYSEETGQLQVQTTGADLQADIYLVIEDEDGAERTIYISPYRDSKNDKRVPTGTYTVKDIYLLDKDYDETYAFKHNDKLLVFPDEKVFFDIEVTEVKENQPNPLLKEESDSVDSEATETTNTEEPGIGSERVEAEESGLSLSSMVGIGAVIIAAIGYTALKYFGFLTK
ncbi:hypothetical protein SAMN04488113_12725 [Alkalibacterium gilvum]|uniref:Uncharacterized protein n=1 Tax=Alkalibacterium gilvum TaxID=1130080 RepID=A0A1H6U424_9LACT|nr:hypothetical protein [Alkalibacterium gilvum]SEI87079.1 hypothetical protein SAMN04488113_12725 [Alkalibacterium gilvum]